MKLRNNIDSWQNAYLGPIRSVQGGKSSLRDDFAVQSLSCRVSQQQASPLFHKAMTRGRTDKFNGYSVLSGNFVPGSGFRKTLICENSCNKGACRTSLVFDEGISALCLTILLRFNNDDVFPLLALAIAKLHPPAGLRVTLTSWAHFG